MKRKTHIIAQDSTDKVVLTIEHRTTNLTQGEAKRNHARLVNSLHTGLRNHFDAAEIKIK